MKRFSEQIKKQATSVRLRAAEKRDLHDRLVAYMEYHPLPTEVKTTTRAAMPTQTLQTDPFVLVRIPAWVLRGMAGTAVLLLAVIPVAAERAVPGDVLYPVKVKVNEEIRSTMAFSPYEKIEWETKRLERRIAEAQLLARDGRLTSEVEASVVEAVEAHRLAAASSIETLRTQNADDASLAEITLASVLDVQSAKLRASGVAAPSTGRSTEAISRAVEVSREEVQARGEQATISLERLMAQVEIETTRTYDLLRSIRPQAQPEHVQEIERRLQDIERVVAEVMRYQQEDASVLAVSSETLPPVDDEIAVATSVATGDNESATTATVGESLPAADTSEVVDVEVVPASTPEAEEQEQRQQLRNALKDIKKLIAFMTDIDLQTNVAIDSLVPRVLTTDEWQTLLREQQTTLESQAEAIRTAVRELEERGVREKVTAGLATLDEMQVALNVAIEAGSWASAQTLLQEASALVDSMQSLIVTSSTPEVIEEQEQSVTEEPETPEELLESSLGDTATDSPATTPAAERPTSSAVNL